MSIDLMRIRRHGELGTELDNRSVFDSLCVYLQWTSRTMECVWFL